MGFIPKNKKVKMTNRSLIIKKKKTKVLISLTFSGFILLMFLYASISALIKDKYDFKIDIYFTIFLLLLSLLGLASMIIPIKKLLSNKPEFEITEQDFIIYDNPKYERIPFSNIMACEIYKTRYTWLIGFFLKSDSALESNSKKMQKMLLKIPNKKSKVVFIGLNFAKIKPMTLKKIINDRIN